MSDPISNMLTSIRNAGLARLPHATVPHSRLKESIARLLLREGYVAEVVVEGKPFKSIKIKLKYTGRKSVIEGLRRVSSPGLRRYLGAQEVPRVLGGLGVSILSTSSGVMTGAQARQKNVGGELLCEVW
jgi:small subunit ribosomal protein S8